MPYCALLRLTPSTIKLLDEEIAENTGGQLKLESPCSLLKSSRTCQSDLKFAEMNGDFLHTWSVMTRRDMQVSI
jgi:hypothetical protein